MGIICKIATAVVVWLGLDQCVTAKGLAFFRKLSRIPDLTEREEQSRT